MATITYYDFSDLYYASFFVQGLLELHDQAEHTFRITKKIPEELKDLELPTWITFRKPPSTIVLRYEDDDHNFLFCIDANDLNGSEPDLLDIYPGYHFPLIERVRFYFKLNYNEEALDGIPAIAPFRHKILPVPIVYPLKVRQVRSLLPKLSPIGGKRWPQSAIKRRMKHLQRLLPLQEYRRLRQLPRDLDLFFITTIYTGHSHDEISAWRLEVLEAISSYSQLKTIIGFISNADDLPKSLARFQLQHMPFETYMANLARSKIGLYTRGTFGALSFKFGQYFALGKPIVGEPLLNNSPERYNYDRFADQFNFSDPKDIAARIADLAANPVELQEIRETNTATFEKYFTPEAVARQIIGQIGQDLSQTEKMTETS